MADLTLSSCGPADLAAVAELVNAAYRGTGGQAGWTHEVGVVDGARTTAETLAAELADSDQVTILGLRAAEELLACVRLERLTDGQGAPVCHIGMLAVRPGEQDRGLGRAMLGHAEAAARAWGALTARMTVVSMRDSLIAWYERRGYRRTGETEAFPYEDARFGTPLRPDLAFIVLEKALAAKPGASLQSVTEEGAG
jgi:ribosomal protein S18 acetylase RimI-like enzyme